MAKFIELTMEQGGKVVINLDRDDCILPTSKGSKIILPEDDNIFYVKENWSKIQKLGI